MPSLSAEEIAAKKMLLEQRTRELTQHLLARSNQTVRAVSNAGGSALSMYVKFKICYQHLASYPKVCYLPLLLFTCGLYGYHSVKHSSVPYTPPALTVSDDMPFANLDSFKRWFLSGITSLVGEVAASKAVQKEGISYLERMFKDKTVHESLIVLLKGAVKDQRFIAESKVFGIDWIKYTLTQGETKDALKELVANTFVKD